jgi:hypothetical protein
MKTAPLAKALVIAFACAGIVGADNDRRDPGGPVPLTVPKPATCGPNDRPETALQGQVPAAMRATGFQGFNCNLTLIGQHRGEGANWQTTQFRQGSDEVQGGPRLCGYHGTASPTRSLPGRQQLGVRVIDLSDRTDPHATAYLTTPSMLDPWESLKVNERRQLLAADNAQNGGFGAGGPEIDIYDLSNDCRNPQLLASAPVGTGQDGGIVVPNRGHEGSFAPDGLTYYIGDIVNRRYHAVDVSDATKPKMIASIAMQTIGLFVHGLSISEDGNRAYPVSTGSVGLANLGNPNAPTTNGFAILDTSEVQARLPNAQMKLVSFFPVRDGSTAQHTIAIRIRGKPYIVHVDEGGSGGGSVAGRRAACAAGWSPFPMARIVDISDEKNPALVSKLMLEVHDPSKCDQWFPDLEAPVLTGFTYGSHYCSVDNRHNATTLACGYFNSGIRVFDIRDPVRPKEIAYYNPAGVITPSAGSNHGATNGSGGKPDWCSAQVHLDKNTGTLWSTCQDNGVLVLKFREGVWPFPGTATPPGAQN